MRIITLFLLLFSFGVNAQTLSWPLPTTWEDGKPLTESDLAYSTVYCTNPAGANLYQQVPRDASGVLPTELEVTFDVPMGTMIFCSVTVTDQYIDASGNLISGAESKFAPGVSFPANQPIPPPNVCAK